MHKTVYVAAFLGIYAPATCANTVEVLAAEKEIAYQVGDAESLTATLQLKNPSVVESPEILLWQLGLDVVPATSATGTLTFAAIRRPPEYIFPVPSEPTIISPLGNTSVDITDLLVGAPNGVLLETEVPRNIVELEFSVSNDASGVFSLVVSPFRSDLFHASYWSPILVLDPGDFLPFDNARPGSDLAKRTVASIEVHTVPEPETGRLIAILGLWGMCSVLRITNKRS